MAVTGHVEDYGRGKKDLPIRIPPAYDGFGR